MVTVVVTGCGHGCGDSGVVTVTVLSFYDYPWAKPYGKVTFLTFQSKQ